MTEHILVGGMLVLITEASAESCTPICFHILVERGFWRNMSKLFAPSLPSTGIDMIRVRCGVWLDGTKLYELKFCTHILRHRLLKLNKLGLGHRVLNFFVIILPLFLGLKLKISRHRRLIYISPLKIVVQQ